MIVVILLAIIALVAVPGVGLWRADARTREGAYAVLKLLRGARYAAMREGAAYAVRYTAAGSNGLGTFEAFRGMTNHCRQGDWADATGVHGAVSVLDMARFNPTVGTPRATDTGRHVVQAIWNVAGATNPESNAVLCYEPSGRVYTTTIGYASTVIAAFTLTPQRLDIRVTTTGTRDGAAESVERSVLLPSGGQPRMGY